MNETAMRDRIIRLMVEKEDELCKDYPYIYHSFRIEKVADHLIANGFILPPCKEGDTIYRIVKFCEENTGYKEFYRPTVEFEENCPYFEPASWYGDGDRCTAAEDYDDGCYCDLKLDILHENCKSRFAIQKDIFSFGKMEQVFGTAMFDDKTELRDRYYLSMEDAERALEEIKNE